MAVHGLTFPTDAAAVSAVRQMFCISLYLQLFGVLTPVSKQHKCIIK
jgi:hypothetical protein